MMRAALVAFLLLTSSLTGEEFAARITYYSGSQTASGKKPVQGVTVAAAKRFKFGTKLSIPELASVVGSSTFIVQDRGPAVEKAVASRGKLPVIDIYVSSQATVRRLARLKKNTFKVKVL